MGEVKRDVRREGGRGTKWDRLHVKEMAEVKAECERIAGRTLAVSDMGPLWTRLNEWARYRYAVARKHPSRGVGGGSTVMREGRVEFEVLPEGAPRDEKVAAGVPAEEKLPWE